MIDEQEQKPEVNEDIYGPRVSKTFPEFAEAMRALFESEGEAGDHYGLERPAGMSEEQFDVLYGWMCKTLLDEDGNWKESKPAEAKASPARKEKPAGYKAKVAAFKKHRLTPNTVPPQLELVFGGEWAHHPGFPDLFIHRQTEFAVQQRYSRRRGHYFQPVAKRRYQDRKGRRTEFFIHWKNQKRTMIPVQRAMFECGLWGGD
jgi:hypothetical protein